MLQIFLLWAILCPQETAPTLPETLEFLTAKLPELATYNGKAGSTTINARVTSARIENCQITITVREEYTGKIQTNQANEYAFPLAAIDPEAIVAKPSTKIPAKPVMILLYLSGKDGKKVIAATETEVSQIGPPRRVKSFIGTARLMLDSQENADRLVNALRHAAKLCSERKEPF